MKTKSPLSPARLGALAAVAMALFAPALARAAGYTVNTLADDTAVNGFCTLREAVQLHNGLVGANDCGAWDAGEDKILLWVGGTIYLNPRFGELVLTTPDLTIEGPGAPKLAIHGGKEMTILVLDGQRPPALTLRAVTLRNGLGRAFLPNSSPLAGGIRQDNYGSPAFGPPTTIVVEDAVFFANLSPIINGTGGGAWSKGAAITSYGTLVVRRTQFQANQSDLGAVWHDGPALFEDCEFSDNQASGISAALAVGPPGPWTVRRTLFRDNRSTLIAAGGIRMLSNDNSDSGLIENCTFAGNATPAGNVLGLQGKVKVRNSTFSANGIGALYSGGVVQAYTSSLELASSLFAGNSRPDLIDGTGGASVLKVAYNLFESLPGQLPPAVHCAPTTANDANLCGVAAPGLGPLSDNGGRTWTMPLLAGSPAIDAGSNPGALTTDQRGAGFPRTSGAQTDIGAFEKQ